jgi:hypothetical protein
MMYVTEFLIGNYLYYFCHQLKQKQNTEWMLYKCTNTIPEQLLEQVMTILLKAQLHVTNRVCFGSIGILSSINKSLLYLSLMIHLDRSLFGFL